MKKKTILLLLTMVLLITASIFTLIKRAKESATMSRVSFLQVALPSPTNIPMAPFVNNTFDSQSDIKNNPNDKGVTNPKFLQPTSTPAPLVRINNYNYVNTNAPLNGSYIVKGLWQNGSLSYKDSGLIINEKLIFASNSNCDGTNCKFVKFSNGDEIEVAGTRNDNGILVSQINFYIEDIPRGLDDSTQQDWYKAVATIKSCKVMKVSQNHRREITLLLSDGRILKASEPVLDEITNEINKAAGVCGTLPVITE